MMIEKIGLRALRVRANRCLAACLLGLIGNACLAQSASGPDPVRPDQVVHSLEGTYGVHPGERRNHIKGTCALGEFVGTAEGRQLSRSALFSGQPVPVVARFSLAGGDPSIADASRSARGMALEFRLPGASLQHITMLNSPVFIATSPTGFNDLILASKPDPATGKPDPEAIKAYFAGHPEAMAMASFVQSHGPPTSYANAAFYSIHTFKFIDAQNQEHLVRWRFVPQDGEVTIPADELAAKPHDFLEQGLIDRTARGAAKWDMIVYVGEPGDSIDNPTLAWPESRVHVKAGTLSITSAMPQHGAQCENVNFNPLVMADGIAPTNDPILLFRSPSYAISFGKRISGQ